MEKVRVFLSSLLLGVIVANLAGCVVAEPHEGYYDHDHHRWYHEHAWHGCDEPGAICR
jgi:hypothetical protein